MADANGFARPTLLLPAIGEPIGNNIRAGILEHHDITCTDRRLSSTTEPLLNAFSSAAIRGHCDHCIAQIPGHPNIRVHRRSAPAICGRHHRWVDATRQIIRLISPTTSR